MPGEPTLPTRVSVPDDVVWQEVEGQAILLTTSRGRYHRLDPIGTRMWAALHEAPDVEAAVSRLLGELDVDEASLRRDLARLVAALAGAGLLDA